MSATSSVTVRPVPCLDLAQTLLSDKYVQLGNEMMRRGMEAGSRWGAAVKDGADPYDINMQMNLFDMQKDGWDRSMIDVVRFVASGDYCGVMDVYDPDTGLTYCQQAACADNSPTSLYARRLSRSASPHRFLVN